jgi:hypothetical protein
MIETRQGFVHVTFNRSRMITEVARLPISLLLSLPVQGVLLKDEGTLCGARRAVYAMAIVMEIAFCNVAIPVNNRHFCKRESMSR